MKELSIEEKAKAYDEAIRKAKDMLNYKEVRQEDMEYLFPELKESEDDIMRKMAIKAVHAPEAQSCIKSWGINPEDVIAWLEKQGEKPAWSEEGLQKEIKLQWKNCNPTDEGMGCEFANISVEQFDEIARYFFKLKYKTYNPTKWSGEDEKMIKSIIASINQESIIDGLKKKGVKYTLDSIAQLMDSQINYLKSLKDRVQPPKREWSKKDKIYLDSIYQIIDFLPTSDSHLTKEDKEAMLNWLSSLKERVLPQPQQKWSEKDEKIMNTTLCIISDFRNVYKDSKEAQKDADKIEDWLKSLRLQSRWKPSDEQMEALWNVYQGGKEQAELATLYNDLKKLRNE